LTSGLASTANAALFGVLVAAVLADGAVVRFDWAANAFLAAWRVPWLVQACLWITNLGSGAALGGIAGTASAFLYAERRAAFIVPLWITILGAQITVWVSKVMVGRVRPEFLPGVATANLPAFPSGHTTGAMATFGFLAYVLTRELPGGGARLAVMLTCAILIALVGFSRVLLRVHFVTDVLGGLLVGAFWLVVGVTLTK
jgi:undecaprenyl-diphosphatase